MTDQEFGDDRDPLLVRPFVLEENESPEADPSTQTWPPATTREVRSAHATADAEVTKAIPRVTSPRRDYRRRGLVIGGVGAVVLLAGAAAGLAALRPKMSPEVSAGPAVSPLPLVTGPATVHPTSAGVNPESATATRRTHRPGPASTKAAVTIPATGTPAAGEPSASPGGGRNQSATVAPATTQPHGVAPATARAGTIRGQNGLCLDLSGGVPIDGNHVQVFECNNSGAQTWTLATDGTLRVAGKCALIVDDNWVQVVTCDGRTTARWRVSDSTLINAADGRCLTDPSGGRRSGTAVVVSDCGGAANQRWSLP